MYRIDVQAAAGALVQRDFGFGKQFAGVEPDRVRTRNAVAFAGREGFDVHGVVRTRAVRHDARAGHDCRGQRAHPE